jgi:hypothetical protein
MTIMGDGKIFVRTCPECSQLHNTADQSGKSTCDACASGKTSGKKKPPPEPPVTTPAVDPK